MIENLVEIMSPPTNPVEVGNKKEWINIERKMRISFPDDYKEFISIYGTGCIGKFLWV